MKKDGQMKGKDGKMKGKTERERCRGPVGEPLSARRANSSLHDLIH